MNCPLRRVKAAPKTAAAAAGGFAGHVYSVERRDKPGETLDPVRKLTRVPGSNPERTKAFSMNPTILM